MFTDHALKGSTHSWAVSRLRFHPVILQACLHLLPDLSLLLLTCFCCMTARHGHSAPPACVPRALLSGLVPPSDAALSQHRSGGPTQHSLGESGPPLWATTPVGNSAAHVKLAGQQGVRLGLCSQRSVHASRPVPAQGDHQAHAQPEPQASDLPDGIPIVWQLWACCARRQARSGRGRWLLWPGCSSGARQGWRGQGEQRVLSAAACSTGPGHLNTAQVTVLEASDRVGGRAHTIEVCLSVKRSACMLP